jgi:hypothetical protein
MYGMVNKAIEDMVRLHHGADTWERIKALAGVKEVMFLTNEAYPDDLTYRLVAASAETLGASGEEVLALFGEHWITYTAEDGYGGLLSAAGSSLPEFLANLPGFHGRVSMIFPDLKPPRFACTEVSSSSLKLHYYTHRSGLASFVLGLLKGLGKRFGTPVSARIVESREAGADHDVFEVTWSAPV